MAEFDDRLQDKSFHINKRSKCAEVSAAQKALRTVVDRIRQEANESGDEISEEDDAEHEVHASKQRAISKAKKQGKVISEAKAPKLRPAGGMSTFFAIYASMLTYADRRS